MVSSLIGLLAAAAPVHFDAGATCPAVDPVEVRKLLALELRPSSHPALAGFVTQVRVDCDGLEVRLTVADPVSRKTLERRIELAEGEPHVRHRLLALAAAELVTVSWTELVTHPEPAVEPADPPPPASLRAEAAAQALQRLELRPRSRLLLQGTVAAGLDAPLLWGAGVRWSWERFEVFGVELDVRVDHGRSRFAQGEVLVTRAGLGFGAHARLGLGRATLRAVLMLRGGAAQLVGSPTGGSVGGSGFGPWAGISGGGAASVELGAMTLELGVEAMAPLAGVVGTVAGADAVRLDRPWAGLHLGVGVAP